jgi:hypothetical protein
MLQRRNTMAEVLDRIGEQLVSAERTLYAASASRAGGAPPARRRLRGLMRRHLVVVAVLVGVSGSAGGLAIADSLGGGTLTDQQYHYTGQRAVPVAAITAEQSAELAILRRPRTAADAIPSGAIMSDPSSAIDVGEDGANVDLSRLAQVSSGVAAWVLPANDGLVCLAVGPVDPGSGPSGGGPGCRPVAPTSPAAQSACDGPSCNDTVPPDQTISGGNLQAGYGTGPGSNIDYIVGVVPDGVSSVTLTLLGGASESVPVRNNVYMTTLRRTGYLPVYANLGENPPPPSAPLTLTVSFDTPTGTITAPFGAQGNTYAFAN